MDGAASAAQRSRPMSAASRAPNGPRACRPSARATRRAPAPSTGRRDDRAARRRRPGRRAGAGCARAAALRRGCGSVRLGVSPFVVQQLERDFAMEQLCPRRGRPRTTCPGRCARAATVGPSALRRPAGGGGSVRPVADRRSARRPPLRSGCCGGRLAMLSTSRRWLTRRRCRPDWCGSRPRSSRWARRRRPMPPDPRARDGQPSTSISSARRTSARVTAMRAASGLALPCAAAICA